ncbi:unnamed protein product [Vitrella brassicaformis CCMP3155]|uniref:PPM-type phosphatase domain-containing protein n=1 Tax=Vitrella brassicaformis (strain CCMP3155) TaxID=1169540 RepID=A0A0G4FK05_VITBC|nr:unnamed protein product [Vitrella brassicaformis CCMP3155]|eukprot:CEM13721.1 unnamed protein product [Vitrella brassicaformis CCMP3155]
MKASSSPSSGKKSPPKGAGNPSLTPSAGAAGKAAKPTSGGASPSSALGASGKLGGGGSGAKSPAAGKDRSNSPASKSPTDKASAAATQQRRRLSVVSGTQGFEADGVVEHAVQEEAKSNLKVGRGGVVSKYASKSKVGVVPMNPNKVNQDSHFEIEQFANDPTQYFFCVMDGHGYQGREVSQLITRRLPNYLQSEPTLRTDPKAAIQKAFHKTNHELFRSSLDITFSGSTTISVFIRGATLYSASVGDSRAICGKFKGAYGRWSAQALSDDHKPDRPDEKKRIEDRDGRVESFRGSDGEPIGPPRVWLKDQDAPGLAMSRSMGDSVAASVGVTAEPEIKIFTLTSEDKFIVLASDGVWEFIDNEEVVKIVSPFHDKQDPQAACDALVKESNQRWRAEEEVIDDTTVIVVFLNAP